jgi:hypothetical protein
MDPAYHTCRTPEQQHYPDDPRECVKTKRQGCHKSVDAHPIEWKQRQRHTFDERREHKHYRADHETPDSKEANLTGWYHPVNRPGSYSCQQREDERHNFHTKWFL